MGQHLAHWSPSQDCGAEKTLVSGYIEQRVGAWEASALRAEEATPSLLLPIPHLFATVPVLLKDPITTKALDSLEGAMLASAFC